MVAIKISALPAKATDLGPTDLFEIADAGVSRQLTGQQILDAVDTFVSLVGVVDDYAGSTAPAGYVFCDGAVYDSVADASFANLFTVIGNLYGGTDGTDFQVPDLRGRVIVGKDDMGGVAASRITVGAKPGVDGTVLGAAGGVEEHAITEAELAAHTHVDEGSDGNINPGTNAVIKGKKSITDTGSTGGDEAHTNLQPSMILNKIIRK